MKTLADHIDDIYNYNNNDNSDPNRRVELKLIIMLLNIYNIELFL